jgi:hypothetical protein
MAKPVTSEVLRKAFHTALILTGSLEQSEAAVLESIRWLDLDDEAPGEKLVRGALQAALARQRQIVEQRSGELECALSLLPLELRRVLRLPADLRHCFALRILAGLPRNVCAPLLHWSSVVSMKLQGSPHRCWPAFLQRKSRDKQPRSSLDRHPCSEWGFISIEPNFRHRSETRHRLAILDRPRHCRPR